MKSDLAGPGCRVHDVMRATEFVVPALEVIDYRTEVPRSIVDTIADNAAFAAMVLGGRVFAPSEIDVRWIAATLACKASSRNPAWPLRSWGTRGPG